MPEVLVDVVEQLELLETAEQGPPGPPGPPSGAGEASPVLTYAAGRLVRVDYASGNYKTLTYTTDRLTRIDYVRGAVTQRRDLSYNPDGTLSAVVDSVV